MLTEYVAVDLEMTGLRPVRDKILEIGAVRVVGRQAEASFQTLVRPGIKIPPQITELTGITQEMADAGKEPGEALKEFVEFYRGLPLVGHNISFDYRFLRQNAINHGLTLEARLLDTLKIARVLLPDLEKKTLEALCSRFQIKREREHRALEDAKAASQLLEIFLEEFQETRPELFETQILAFKVKKQGPITPRQKKHLKELANYHKIELPVDLECLSKSEASRLADQIFSRYGRIPKG